MTPVLVFDGDCGFCTRSVEFMKRHIPTSATILAWQRADLDALGTSRTRARYELLWVCETGEVYGGAQAVARALCDAGGTWALLGYTLRVPPVRWAAALAYRAVAANRYRLPGGTPACALPEPAGSDPSATPPDRADLGDC